MLKPRLHNLKDLGLLTVAIAIAVGTGAACSPAKWRETSNTAPAPFTADPLTERQTTPNTAEDFKEGDKGYVRPGRLCGRRIPTQKCDDVDIIVEQGDEVTVKDPNPKGDEGFIEVEITDKEGPPLGPIYVPPQYISKEPVTPTTDELSADRYIVIQNIATEKLRVYENCGGRDCAHKLILETDMVVGQNTRERRSLLGSYRITKWFKFYEDNQSDYPSWFNPSYPEIPGVGAELKDWVTKKLLPNGRGTARGAFGWYTAHIGPNADEQWLHGTWGWGADGDRFIQAVRQSPYDNDPRISSHGCTRVENQAIAMMREILPPGTKVIKVYARETTGAEASGGSGKWNWILTSEDVDAEDGERSGRASVTDRQVSKDQVLESGLFTFDARPSAVPLTSVDDPHRNGNSYGLPKSSFRGEFLVDEGRLVGYRHPKELKVGGHVDKTLPSVVLKKSN